ncbi:3-methyladenine DNA glycosylase [Solicola gregarius]|uniref:3-methyladenine DNA glycosylase n=1 Tax=Solicola gregarius TaxID=2908642 RepID=A0AA46TJ22_9ACTN|nr:3-methyladenine DNA glycosylase [Solicola gregarius]UYM05779.1 3-methyladenine DNA glycosylase [Solicola gregarius]
MALTVWATDDWHPVAAEHRARVRTWTAPHLARRESGVRHPVEDFLFEYYSFSPGKLERWHPGIGQVLAGPGVDGYRALADYRAYDDGVGADPERLGRRRDGLVWMRDLLALTQGRDARTNCFGLHEWAMVYRTRRDEVRHEAYPLRLGHRGTDEVVESHQLRCTHFDAFRFFTDEARPRNAAELSRATQPSKEQPGCLHANMDLYRAAYKFSPFVRSELVADCFELARDIRELDMRASPYDLSSLGYAPVRIEDPAGKAEYVAGQRAFAGRAAVLRGRLIDELDELLGIVRERGPSARIDL